MVRHRCFLRSGAVWGAIGLLMLLPATSFGVVVAFDGPDAADPAYADGWDPGDNGGFGFQPWFAGMYGNPVEIDTDTPEADNDLGAPAFRLGTGGISDYTTRLFANPMAAGQSFKTDYDPVALNVPDPADFVYVENDNLIVLGKGTGQGTERFSLFKWQGKYNDGQGMTSTYGVDEWGIKVASAFNNLAGGAALPLSGDLFMTGYSGTDSSDGFSMTLDLVSLDTYRFRIVDDNVTKVDVSGHLYDGPSGALAGLGLDSLTFYASDATPSDIDTSYFRNLQILDTPSVGVPGDYNNNGKVDAADYVLWRKGGTLANEVDATGTINAADYAAWRARFGNSSGSGTSLGGPAIPEPASWILAIVGSAMLAGRPRSR